jgi:DNA ligase (NAD+)
MTSMTATTDAPAAVLPDLDAYTQAVQQAVQAAAAYYCGGDSPLDDDAYDRLVRGIAAFEERHPDHVLPASPTGKVAGGAVTGDVPHTAPMLSLDNVFAPEQLAAWAAGVERRIGRPVAAWSVEPKLDGLAIAARYEQGRLVRMVTRGNGTAGEDVSHAIGTVVGLLDHLAAPATVEIRGEVLMTHQQFEQANTTRTAHGAAPFANARNGAAGTLRAQDRPYRVEMTFFAYGALPTEGSPAKFAAWLHEAAHHEVMAAVADLGVQTTAATAVGLRTLASLEEAQDRIEEIAALRAELPFGIDGIVVKADLVADQNDAGFSSRAPRWAIAYKLPAVEKVTRLIEVEWAVGRTGIIAPRAVLEPVEIDGSTVTYATLLLSGKVAL